MDANATCNLSQTIQHPSALCMPSGGVGALCLNSSCSHSLPDEWEAPGCGPSQEDGGSESVECGKVLAPEGWGESQEPIWISLKVLGVSERGEHRLGQREGFSVTTKRNERELKKMGGGNKEKFKKVIQVLNSRG